ncbi:MFS transporter [Loigolactobacillus jiayinensis]|uniref:MFS transporter n=1 Tax=Loigolactobacillus jiayinensis TaxID=2486016 RepID=A0ABW1RBH5_9LACO|nr:MFS transporter [Loigolactobacillus jiayinensis]
MKDLKTRVGVLSLCILAMSALVITNAFSAIIAAFPNESVAKIQMLGTIPSLGTLLTTVVVGILAVHIPKKILALIGVVLVGVGGLLPLIFHTNLDLLLVCALILGIGLGFTVPVTTMLISILFSQEERADVMGQSTAINSLGSVIMMFGGGLLGGHYWQNTYYIFLITIAIFLLVLFLIPMDKVAHTTTEQGQTEKVSAWLLLRHLSKYVFIVSFIGLFMSMIYTIYPTNLSIIVATKHLGGTSITGIVNAIGTIGGLVAGFSLRYFNKLFKDKILVAGFITLGITFLLIRIANNLAVVIIGALLSGFAMAMVMATIPFYVSVVSAPVEIAISMSLCQFLNSLGGTFTPIILSALHIQAGNAAFTTGIIASAVMAVICLVFSIGKRVMTNGQATKSANKAVAANV